MRDNHGARLALIGASAAAFLAASAVQPAQAAVNYNASKSNTGNFAAHRLHPCKHGMTKDCTNGRARAAVTQYDLGHGQLAGKRRHSAVVIRREIDKATP